jgi:hypothetical protein
VCHSVTAVKFHHLGLKADDVTHNAPPDRLSPEQMKPTTNHRSIVALNLPINTLALVKKGKGIVGAMTQNPLFPSPTPPLPTVSASIDALALAEQATEARTKGAVEARDAARATVREQLHQLGSYVQLVMDADKENAEKIAASAQMSTRKLRSGTRTDFEARVGPVSGSVHLIARSAARRAGYEWQWSVDGGKTWQPAAVTLQAKTTITGLPVATSCQFRFRPVTKTGEGAWSQVVTFVVQ